MEETTIADDDFEYRWYRMLFGIRRSIRYHQRRRAFFDRLDQLTNAFALIFGSAALYGVLGENADKVAVVASAIVTTMASINLVVGSSKRARDHADFARQFIELEKSMIGKGTEERLQAVTEKRLTIEASEPPVLRVLDIICHNEQMRAEGYKRGALAKIGPLQYLFAHFFDWRESTIQQDVFQHNENEVDQSFSAAITEIRSEIKSIRTTNSMLIFFAITAAALGLAGLMSKWFSQL